MISLLRDIVEVILNIPLYFQYAIETMFNALGEAIHAIFAALVSIIPLPSVPGPPEYIANINWFFPIGAIISIMLPMVISYVAFLSIRWVYQKVGDL